MVAWCIYLAIAFTLTHTPPGEVDLVPSFLSDTILHAVGYTILGALSIWLVATNRRGLTWPVIVITFLGLLAYGALDEGTQPWVGRSCELSDWLADAAGAFVGILLAVMLHRRFATGPSVA